MSAFFSSDVAFKIGSLLVASKCDTASINIANNLLKVNKWKTIQSFVSDSSISEGYTLQSKTGFNFFMWIQDLPLLKLDLVDQIFMKKYNINDCSIQDIIFLSKHCAASGTTSLTVHPIGIPWQKSSKRSGGRPGRCSPPNPKLAELYREILKSAKYSGLDQKFQVY